MSSTSLKSLKCLDKDRMIPCCPMCKSHKIRKRHQADLIASSGLYVCYGCKWSGNIIEHRPCKARVVSEKCHGIRKEVWKKAPIVVVSVKYEDIIKNLLSNMTIKEQFIKFGIAGKITAHEGQRSGIRHKILRVYSAYVDYTGIPCEDPDFVKIRYTPDVQRLLISAIEEEETRIRNSPRLSVTYSK